MAKKKKETVTINKKALLGIISLMPLTGIILSRGQVGSLVLLIIGTAVGIFIGKNLE